MHANGGDGVCGDAGGEPGWMPWWPAASAHQMRIAKRETHEKHETRDQAAAHAAARS